MQLCKVPQEQDIQSILYCHCGLFYPREQHRNGLSLLGGKVQFVCQSPESCLIAY
jgi:hypothetical protein